MNPANSNDKGNLLEAAVELIERAVVKGNVAFDKCEVVIEPKKRIRVSGVQHEIDLHVAMKPGNGYDSVFIFECKNWEDKVGKNEIIIFSTKIDASNATRGFFVARGYTKDAEAQARQDPRMELLLADTSFESYDYLGFANSFGVNMKRVLVELIGLNDLRLPNPDFIHDLVILDGRVQPIRTFLNGVGAKFIRMKYDFGSERRMKEEIGVPVKYTPFDFNGRPIDQGVHIFHDKATLDYGSKNLFVNSKRVLRVVLHFDHQLEIMPPRVHWVCQIGARGRAVRVEYYTPEGPLLLMDVASTGPDAKSTMMLRAPLKPKPS